MRVVSVLIIGGLLLGCSRIQTVVIPPPPAPIHLKAPDRPGVASDHDPRPVVLALEDKARLRRAGMVVFDAEPGRLYQLSVKVHFTSTVSWPAGERLISGPGCRLDEPPAVPRQPPAGKVQPRAAPIVAPSTEPPPPQDNNPPWTVSCGYHGSGEQRREHLEITAHEPKLDAAFVVATTRGLYHLRVRSTTGEAYTPAVALWSEPEPPVTAAVASGPPSLVTTTGLLGIGYTPQAPKGHVPAWARSMRAWDDLHRTYIALDPMVRSYEVPAVYAITDDGQTTLVNVAMDPPPYPPVLVMDRLSAVGWRLELGESWAEVRRSGAYAFVNCPGAEGCP